MTIILLNDLENIIWTTLSGLVPLIVPLIVISLFAHFTRDILFNR